MMQHINNQTSIINYKKDKTHQKLVSEGERQEDREKKKDKDVQVLVLGSFIFKSNEVSQLSWLERYTDNVEVGSSSLPETTNYKTGR